MRLHLFEGGTSKDLWKPPQPTSFYLWCSSSGDTFTFLTEVTLNSSNLHSPHAHSSFTLPFLFHRPHSSQSDHLKT